MVETKSEVSKYIQNRNICNGTCKYKGFCPEYPPLKELENPSCIIYGLGKLDVFYNLFFGDADGIKNELQRTLYKLEGDGDSLQYLQACTKTMTTVYGNDSKSDIVPPKVNINIKSVGNTKVDKSNTKSAKSNTKLDKKSN